MIARLRSEEGFGLMELLIAMTVLVVGLTALVAAFSSAIVGSSRAIKVQTATSLADSQIESFKMLVYDNIGVDTSSTALTPLDATYKNDTACYDSVKVSFCTTTTSGNTSWKKLIAPTGATCTAGSTASGINSWFFVSTMSARPCDASRSVVAGDGRTYRVDTYVVISPAGSGYGSVRARKLVTVVVRDTPTFQELARDTTTIDCSTAAPGVSACP
jgi:type II secretory pathway pseudopilin PulG